MVTQKGKFVFAMAFFPYIDGCETRIDTNLVVKEVIKETNETFKEESVPSSMFYLTKQDDLDIIKKQLLSFVDETWAHIKREEEELISRKKILEIGEER